MKCSQQRKLSVHNNILKDKELVYSNKYYVIKYLTFHLLFQIENNNASSALLDYKRYQRISVVGNTIATFENWNLN